MTPEGGRAPGAHGTGGGDPGGRRAEAPREAEARLRRDARAIFDSALAAVEPEALVTKALAEDPVSLPGDGRILGVAVGKAAAAMARGAARALPRVDEGIALLPAGGEARLPPSFRPYRGGHPLPDQGGMEGARAIRELARKAGPDDRVIVLLSGGGSALLSLPAADVTLDDLREVTRLLARAGADIRELNTVRKHLEVLKGGGLGRVAVPAPLHALVLSDVVGDPLDVIASGPVSPDPTTYADAIAVLERHDLWDRAPPGVRTHLLYGREEDEPETPKPGDPCFEGVEIRVVGNVARALDAAAERARELGYRTEVRSAAQEGEARHVGAFLASTARELEEGRCLLFGGETTVTVEGGGRGGRNQEVALSAARDLEGWEGRLVLSAGTDGVDGPTDAAGALATGHTAARGRARGLDVDAHLERNDAYPFFEALGDLVVTGPTGTNVMDVMLVLTDRRADWSPEA